MPQPCSTLARPSSPRCFTMGGSRPTHRALRVLARRWVRIWSMGLNLFWRRKRCFQCCQTMKWPGIIPKMMWRRRCGRGCWPAPAGRGRSCRKGWRASRPIAMGLSPLSPLSGALLSAPTMRGMELFCGKADCTTCHAGQFQTDHQFHAIAMPQIGPGKAARFERHNRDVGRLRVTGDVAGAYRFRTPSLRNRGLSWPYDHAGTYATIDGVVAAIWPDRP